VLTRPAPTVICACSRPARHRRAGGVSARLNGRKYLPTSIASIVSQDYAPKLVQPVRRWHVRRPNRNRLYLKARGGEFGITSRRLHVSLPAPSPEVAKAKFRAFPPLVLRRSSGRPPQPRPLTTPVDPRHFTQACPIVSRRSARSRGARGDITKSSAARTARRSSTARCSAP
jgi:hypothetical protein